MHSAYIPFIILMLAGAALMTLAALKNRHIWLYGARGEYRAVRALITGIAAFLLGFVGMAVMKVGFN